MHPTRSSSRQRGLTLVELMIVILLGVVVVLGAGAIYNGVERSFQRGAGKVVDRREATLLSTVLSRRVRTASDFMIYDVSDRFTERDTGNAVALLDEDGDVTWRFEWDAANLTLADSTGARVTALSLVGCTFVKDPSTLRTIRYAFRAADGTGEAVDIESAATLRN